MDSYSAHSDNKRKNNNIISLLEFRNLNLKFEDIPPNASLKKTRYLLLWTMNSFAFV